MNLADLSPEFLVIEGPGRWSRTDDIRAADGVMFLCPVCYGTNGGPIGTHSVVCWTPKVPADVAPGPGRWELFGSGLDDLSLVAGSSSVRLTGGCNAHFYVRRGKIVMC